jgi:hypothetical protein
LKIRKSAGSPSLFILAKWSNFFSNSFAEHASFATFLTLRKVEGKKFESLGGLKINCYKLSSLFSENEVFLIFKK